MTVWGEIIAIGNEVLLGDVLDTNSHWLCVQLTGLGALVRRVTQVRDELMAIQQAVEAALGQGTQLVITTGGLGPTHDDLTLQAVSRALGRDLEIDPLAFSWVRERYRELNQAGYVASPEMTEPRIKMARLPVAAESGRIRTVAKG